MKKIFTFILMTMFLAVLASCTLFEHIHYLTEVKAVEATCTEEGREGYFYCKGCDTYFSDRQGKNEIKPEEVGKVIPAKGHDYEFVEFVWAEDYSSAKAKFVCSRNHEHIKEVDAVITTTTVSATCENKGKIVYIAAIEGHSDQKTVEDGEPLNHDWKFKEFVWASDNKTAKVKLVCSRDATHTKEEDATMTSATKSEATYDAAKVVTYTATYGDHTASKDVTEGEALVHTHNYEFKEIVWTLNEETNEWTAKAVLECKGEGCKATTKEEDLTVTVDETKSVAATETTEGKKVLVATYDEEHKSEKEVTLPRLDHTTHVYGENPTPTWTWNNDHTEATASFACTFEGCTHTEVVKATGTQIVYVEVTAATENLAGEGKYTATITFGGKEYTNEQTVVLPATGGEQHEHEFTTDKGYKYEDGKIYHVTECACQEQHKEEMTLVEAKDVVASENMIAVVGTIVKIDGSGNIYLAMEGQATLELYKSAEHDFTPVSGDKVYAVGMYKLFNTQAELDEGNIVLHVEHQNRPIEKVEDHATIIELPTEALSGSTVTFKATAEEGYQLIVKVNGEPIEANQDGSYSFTIKYVNEIKAIGQGEPTALPVSFKLGADGEAGHVDGTGDTSFVLENGTRTLLFADITKLYKDAKDADGNGAIKLGTGSATGGFSFTVDEDVNYVIIRVASYKTNATSITVNGETIAITAKSNSGEAQEILLDTTTNKTVTLTSGASGDKRLMVYSIDWLATAPVAHQHNYQFVEYVWSVDTSNQYGWKLQAKLVCNEDGCTQQEKFETLTLAKDNDKSVDAQVGVEGKLVIYGQYEDQKRAEKEITIAALPQPQEGEESVTIDLTAQGYENGEVVDEVTVDPITATFDKGTNSNGPKYYTTGDAVRMYGSNTVTLTGGTIVKVEFTFGEGDGSNAITANEGTYNNGVWTGSSTELTFTIGGTSGQRRIQGIKVTYLASAPQPHVHEYQPVAEVPSTCEEQGTAAHYTCSDCDKLFVKVGEEYQETTLAALKLPLAAHTYGEPEWEWDGYESAEATFTCEECDDIEFVEGTAVEDTTQYVAPTETTKGQKVWKVTVTFGGKNYTDTKVQVLTELAHQHSYQYEVRWDNENKATLVGVCACKDETDPIELTVTSQTTPSTCYEAGKTVYTALIPEGYQLAEGKTNTKEVPLPLLEHNYVFEVDWDDLEDPLADLWCSNEGCEFEDIVEVTITREYTKPSTITEKGLITYTGTYQLDENHKLTDTKSVEEDTKGEYVFAVDKSGLAYMTSEIANLYYIKGVADKAAAAILTVYSVQGGYNLMVGNKYLGGAVSGTHNNIKLVETLEVSGVVYLWTWDKELETFVIELTSGTFFAGQDATHDTFSIYSVESENIPAQLVTFETVNIEVVDGLSHGTLEVSNTKVIKGGEVIITITPEKKYELDELTILDEDAEEVEFTLNNDGTYTVVAESDLTIGATFKLMALTDHTITVTADEYADAFTTTLPEQAKLFDEIEFTVTVKDGYQYLEVEEVLLDGKPLTATEGKYSFEVSKNHEVKVVLKDKCASEGEAGYQQLTNISDLVDGSKIQIRNTDGTITLGDKQNNNFKTTNDLEKGVEITVEVLSNGLFALNTKYGYLTAASNSSNYLRVADNCSNGNAQWSITLEDGNAVIVSQGTFTRNIIRYNDYNSPNLFSCYEEGKQNPVTIYIYTVGSAV